ncbi:MAG: ABC transporter permease [Acidobacteria bacterium]|nr:ABC transporter permease [Acidobacteriota bacterium]
MMRLAQDIRYGARAAARSPLFAVVAILSLAVGIGANTAIFTFVDQLLLRPLPVKNPQELVMLYQTGESYSTDQGFRAHSYPTYQEFQRKAEPFSEVICRRETSASVTVDDQTERVDAEMVSGNFFSMLGVRAAYGRVFDSATDDRLYGGHPVVVLGYDYWKTRFAADPGVIGRKVLVNRHPMTIVGVSAEGFAGLDPARAVQIRVPIQMKPVMAPDWRFIAMDDPRQRWIQVFARLKPGYTVQSAAAPMQVLFRQIREYETTQPGARHWSEGMRWRFLTGKLMVEAAATGYSLMRNSFSTALTVLMFMVGLVLLVACTNVANVLIARAYARQKEIAIRLAVGASRQQLLRQLLVEGLMLSTAGGLIGIGLAVMLTRGLMAMVPVEGNPLLIRPQPDGRILLFTLVLTCLTGVLFGLIPALKASHPDLCRTLKDVGTGGGPGASLRLRKGLVAAQVALSFLLLFGAGMFVKTLENLRDKATGIRDESTLITFQVAPGMSGYGSLEVIGFSQRLVEALRRIPGVKAAASARVALLHGWWWENKITVEGHQAKYGDDATVYLNAVTPGYFETLGVPMLEGRDFDWRDARDRAKVAVVNRSFAEHYFGGRAVVGRYFGWGARPGVPLDVRIVGVVEDTLYEGPREGVRRQAFVPADGGAGPGKGGIAFYVRTAARSSSASAAIRDEVRKLDSTVPVYEMKTLNEQLDETLLPDRLTALLSSCFGLVSALLAAIGLYGILAYVVARRSKELGIRIALGAWPLEVIWLISQEALSMIGWGLAIGVPMAVVLWMFASARFYGVKAADPLILLGAVGLLVAISGVAVWIPARRALGADPLRALRYE